MADQKKQFTIVLASQGADKLEAQFKAMQAAAASMGGSIDSALSSLNTKTGTARQTFKVATDGALSFADALRQVERALKDQKGLAWFQNGKPKSALSSIKEKDLPGNKQETTGVLSTAWKEANAARAEANRKVWAEEQAALERRAKLERDIARANGQVIIQNWKETERQKTLIAQQEQKNRETAFNASVRAQMTALNSATKLHKAEETYGAGSFQAASIKTAIQEAAIRQTLQAQISKIQSQVSAGKFGNKAADNRLTAAFSTAQQQLNALNSGLAKHNQSLQEAEKSQSSFAGRVIESISIYRIFNATINTAIEGLKSIPRVGIQLEQTTATLTATFGSFGQAAQQIQYLNAEAERTGLSLATLRSSYATFSASALLAGQSAATVQKIFSDVNTTATTLHLTTDQVNGVFLALSQMFNKGKVQAEELTKQLSQTLPGITNQAAIALGKSAAELGEQMKKGLIPADDAVQKMMARMAEAFGGPAFQRASSNLNAELGRLSTGWTHLAENVYKATESSMTSSVRWATSLTESFAKVIGNSYETGRAVETMAGTMTLIGLAALAKYAAAALNANTSIIALKAGTLSFMAVAESFAPTAILVGLSAIIAKAYETADALDEARKHAQALSDAKNAALKGPEAVKDLAVQNDREVQEFTGQIQALQKAVDSLMDTPEANKNRKWLGLPTAAEMKSEIATLKEAKKAREALLRKETAVAPQAAYKPFESADLTAIAAEAEIATLEKAGKKKEALIKSEIKNQKEARDQLLAEQQKARDAFFSGTLSGEDWVKAGKQLEETERLLSALDAKAQAAGETVKEKSRSKSAAVKAGYTDVKTSLQDEKNAVTESLQQLETQYSNNVIAISDYYAKKKALQQEDLALQIKVLKEQNALAVVQGDSSKVASTNLKLKELAQKQSDLTQESLRGETAAWRGLEGAISDINAEYQQMLGKNGNSKLIDFQQKYREGRDKLIQEKNGVNTTAQRKAEIEVTLKQYDALESYNKKLAESQNAVNSYSLTKQHLTLQEERIQNNLKLGAVSEIEALYQTQQARKSALDSMNTYITTREQALAGLPEGNEEVLSIRRIREEWKSLSAETSLVASKFTTILGNNFSQGLVDFATRSKTAGQAFSAFASGVLNDLAKIAAQEASSQIMKLIISAAGSAFSSTASSTGTANQAAWDSISGWGSGISPSKKGNVVEFRRGGIPDIGMQRQTFQFKRGGVGSLREDGPEAILPLKRDASGNLGVKQVGGGSAGGNVYNISVQVTANKNDSADETGMKIARAMMKTIAREEISNATRAGNTLNKTTKFG
jgi:tape measure domain-containing protein